VWLTCCCCLLIHPQQLQPEYNEWGFDVKGYDKDGFDKYGEFHTLWLAWNFDTEQLECSAVFLSRHLTSLP
jgi:hypothetical protein